MPDLLIRGAQKGDEPAIQQITFNTGDNGEDLTGRGIFDDARLLALMYPCYYLWNEPENCFVAEDIRTHTVVGYIVGTTDTNAQRKQFRRTTPWRIIARLIFVTSWRYPHTFMETLREASSERAIQQQFDDAAFFAEYPGHLHINVLPERQGQGAGTQLMRCFESHLVQLGVPGVHLETSNYNKKAVPFYKKMGFSLLWETRDTGRPSSDDYRGLTFAKKLIPGPTM